jgi:hypothetical protein
VRPYNSQMNEHKTPRGNKAKNDKDSILADAKNLLIILLPADEGRKCVVCLPRYSSKSRLNKKYNLKLKSNDKDRNHRCH